MEYTKNLCLYCFVNGDKSEGQLERPVCMHCVATILDLNQTIVENTTLNLLGSISSKLQDCVLCENQGKICQVLSICKTCENDVPLGILKSEEIFQEPKSVELIPVESAQGPHFLLPGGYSPYYVDEDGGAYDSCGYGPYYE